MKVDIAAKSYGQTRVLGRVSFGIAPGEVIALTGPSGVGKSTLVRIISGLDERFSGTVEGTGRVGMVFQEPTLLPWRNIFQNVVLAAGCSAEMARNALDQVELGHRLDAFPGQLSLGQRRRVALARALAADPQVLILDEAFSSLDEATALRMRQLTRNVLDRNGFRAIIVTHNFEEAVDLADRVLLLDGSPAEILLDHRIEAPRGQRDLAAELARLKEPLGRVAPDAPRPQVATHRAIGSVARKWRILPVRPKV